LKLPRLLHSPNIYKMLSHKNTVIIASAGSGKTTYIVEEALRLKTQNVLITTYTNENMHQIRMFLVEKAGCIPANITVQSWYSVLLQECVRPYQNHMSNHRRVRSIYFQKQSSKFQKKEDYFTLGNDIYSNKAAEFGYECNQKSAGLILERLERIYAHIFIDELQDFAGYDLSLLELFFKSDINIVAVGDPRQATFSTNNAQKNRQHRRCKIYSWLKEKQKTGEIEIEEKTYSHRCNQQICDFADKLFPEYSRTNSQNTCLTGHDGVYYVHKDDVEPYINAHNPVLLRYNIRTPTLGFNATNIGVVKGRTFDRVLIFPTRPMVEYLRTEDISRVGDKSKLYVAVTRAKHSAAFVVANGDIIKNISPWNH